ncbi:MAG TPA: AAA family ATPase [Candidatus Limnocylindria bacterium]|nr:AAA family ATPase [Candidatus Limnocylindria bacterium]
MPVIELHENRRQSERWERDALALLRDGRGAAALERYQDRGRVVAGEDADAVRQQLVTDWWAARDADRSVMIAFRRVDVRDLNGRARMLMRASGALGRAELQLAAGGFAAGDRVVLRRNDRALGVSNGDRGTIAGVDPTGRTIDVQLSGRRVRLDAGYLDSATRHGPSLQHAYAITGHVAQGLTFRQTFVLATDHISREWAYSALSRGRESNRLYTVAARSEERDEYAPSDARRPAAREQLAAALERSDAHTLATDIGREQRLVAELQHVVAEHESAVRAHDTAVSVRADLERDPPHPLRRRARRRHGRELARARDDEARTLRRVEAWSSKETTVRAQLEQERRARVADKARDPTVELERVRSETRAQRLARLGLERPERILERAVDGGRGLGR